MDNSSFEFMKWDIRIKEDPVIGASIYRAMRGIGIELMRHGNKLFIATYITAQRR